MREGVPSGTSFLVAFARGLGVDARPPDPFADKLLPGWLGRVTRAPQRLGPAASIYRASLRTIGLGLVDHVVLRTEALDEHVSQAFGAGVEQLVILGAGLDMRAWRLPVLRHAQVYEVDHPSTQGYKRKRVDRWDPPTRIQYVAVDFERESFAERLLASGFDPAVPSMWIWEGVAMYLPEAAVLDALRQIGSLAAQGSRLAMTYREPNALPLGALGRVAIPVLFSVAGEALKHTMTPDDVASALAPDWKVTYDEDPAGWRRTSGSAAKPARNFEGERMTVAEKLS